jgi:hypothetical protein
VREICQGRCLRIGQPIHRRPKLILALLLGSNLVLEVDLPVAKVLNRFFPTQVKSNFIEPLVNKTGQVFFHHNGTHPSFAKRWSQKRHNRTDRNRYLLPDTDLGSPKSIPLPPCCISGDAREEAWIQCRDATKTPIFSAGRGRQSYLPALFFLGRPVISAASWGE